MTSKVFAALRDLASKEPLRVTVQGVCMTPALVDGTTVEVRARRIYAPGDVVAFRGLSGTLVLHRVIGYRPLGGRVALVTQADASRAPDRAVPLSSVVGRVDGRVPLGRRAKAFGRFLRAATARLLAFQ